jgi:phosphotriesterase-related protein
METLETVRGPVPLDRLGPTLMHEHVFVLDPEALINYGRLWGESYWDEEAGVTDAIQKLRRLRDAGIETIVDPTALGLGRDIRRIKRVNEGVDLNIVVATGVYAFLELPGFLGYRSDDWLVELFVREIREGIDDTGVKASFLKCCIEHYGIIGDIPRILSTVAAAAVETDAPVMVHTSAPTRRGLDALEFLTGKGVDPRRIVIAHAGDSNDLDYLRALADRGAWLGQDRYGIEHFNPSADRLATTIALLAEGYADRIQLGHDSACFYDFMQHNPPFAHEKPDLLRIHNEFLPALRDSGVSDAQIDQMLLANPRAFFSGRGGPEAPPPSREHAESR